MALQFATLTAQEIKDYMEEHKATKAQKADFKKHAFVDKVEKVSVKVYSNDGSPVMYQVKNKDGSPKVDSNGKPVMRQKIEMVDKKDGNKKKVFSLLDAKWWFAENYPDALEGVPKRKKEEPKAGDLFEDW